MAERVASRLRPDRETVRLVADGNRLQQLAAGRVDDVDDPVVAAREPQLFAVDAEMPMSGLPAVGIGHVATTLRGAKAITDTLAFPTPGLPPILEKPRFAT